MTTWPGAHPPLRLPKIETSRLANRWRCCPLPENMRLMLLLVVLEAVATIQAAPPAGMVVGSVSKTLIADDGSKYLIFLPESWPDPEHDEEPGSTQAPRTRLEVPEKDTYPILLSSMGWAASTTAQGVATLGSRRSSRCSNRNMQQRSSTS